MPKPLIEKNPLKAKIKMRKLSELSDIRRLEWINKMYLEN